MLYHTDEKPYSCPTCGRAFKELSTLQNHERIHSGERPFVCETCGKSFRQRVSYLVHRRIHTGVMPYSCDLCGKKFRYKVTQRTHKCPGKTDDDTIFQDETNNEMEKSLRPLSEDAAVLPSEQAQSVLSNVPALPEEVKQNLMRFRQAQGKKNLQSRLANILSQSANKSTQNLLDPAQPQQLNQPYQPAQEEQAVQQSLVHNLYRNYNSLNLDPFPQHPQAQPLVELQHLTLDDDELAQANESGQWSQNLEVNTIEKVLEDKIETEEQNERHLQSFLTNLGIEAPNSVNTNNSPY